MLFRHGTTEMRNGYEHQNSYADPNVLASMLYSIVQIAKKAKWEKIMNKKQNGKISTYV